MCLAYHQRDNPRRKALQGRQRNRIKVAVGDSMSSLLLLLTEGSTLLFGLCEHNPHWTTGDIR